MRWRLAAIVGLLAIGLPGHAEETPVGTITFGKETLRIVHARAYENEMMNAIDVELFDEALPAGETFFSLESDARAAVRGMRLRINPEYRNGTWIHPSIEGHDQFYYFDETDPIVLTYETRGDRIRGSIAGKDEVGGTSIAVKVAFDLPIAKDPE